MMYQDIIAYAKIQKKTEDIYIYHFANTKF